MPDDNTQQLNDPLDTKPLIEQLAREMVLTREMLMERFDRFEGEIRRELRTLGNRLDVLAIELNKTQAETRDIGQRMTELEQKPA